MKNKMYSELLEVMNKYDEELRKDYELDIRNKLAARLRASEILNNFGIDISTKRFSAYDTYLEISNNQFIALYGKEHNRQISWSDTGEQPENEWLYGINFPTGPYVFHEDYPSGTFNSFFNELKSYEPKYCDTVNKYLLFDKTKSKAIHENFKNIFNKYRELSLVEIKEFKINKLKDELERLKNE